MSFYINHKSSLISMSCEWCEHQEQNATHGPETSLNPVEIPPPHPVPNRNKFTPFTPEPGSSHPAHRLFTLLSTSSVQPPSPGCPPNEMVQAVVILNGRGDSPETLLQRQDRLPESHVRFHLLPDRAVGVQNGGMIPSEPVPDGGQGLIGQFPA